MLWWFSPYISFNQPQVYMCPPHPEPFRPPSPPHPSGLSQSTGFGCPAPCAELALVLCLTYGNVRVSVLLPQITPRSPSPTESKSLFFTSVSPFVALHVGSLVPSFYIPYTCINIQYLSFSFWLISLCIIDSRFIDLIRTDKRGDTFAKYGTK